MLDHDCVFFIYLLQGQDPRWRRYQFRTAHLAGQVENRIGTSRQLGHFEEGNNIKKNTLDIPLFSRLQCRQQVYYTSSVTMHMTWDMVRLPVAFIRQPNVHGQETGLLFVSPGRPTFWVTRSATKELGISYSISF